MTWNKDGGVIIKNLISKKIIKNCFNTIKKIEKQKTHIPTSIINEIYKNKRYIRYIPKCHESVSEFLKLINSAILKKSSELLKSNVYFWDSDFHSRWGDEAVNTPPHQDSFLKCLEENNADMLTCYIPLTEINKHSNPMCIIKGSFKKKTLSHKKSKKLGFSSVIEENETFLDKKLLKKEQEVLLMPGDVFFFHGKTIHYSKIDKNKKKKTKRRMAVAIRILGENVKFSKIKLKKYQDNVRYNRSFAIKKGLTRKNLNSVKSI